MLQWIKRLFGFADEVVTLAGRQAKAEDKAKGILDQFDYMVTELHDAAAELNAVAAEARTEAEALIAQAGDAEDKAAKNTAAAQKISGLLS